ncbi:uncharacterized protein SCHCODRAFT_02726307, partial [Schizophyllum commune H4-8]|uniref:uncharacterized protein n=1 Tax=Schizophyllum commune (strain H4-8 / FGSC 9210) TaxID=578458 RepID=UPI00215EB306
DITPFDRREGPSLDTSLTVRARACLRRFCVASYPVGSPRAPPAARARRKVRRERKKGPFPASPAAERKGTLPSPHDSPNKPTRSTSGAPPSE